MWSEQRSLALSRVCTVVFGALLVVLLVSGPWLVRWLMGFSTAAQKAQPWQFLTTLYTGGAAAAVLLWKLYKVLANLAKGQVFLQKNVTLLRAVSWLCFVGAGVCLASGLYYFPWWLVGAAAAFVGLIVRVVKNIIAEAIVLKEENDYTI